jgi:predicted nucleic acid-binding Zn ribbon protein
MEPLGPEVRKELAQFGPQAGMAELVERWPAAVGPVIARNAWPARIARDGTVHVNTADSVWAFELGQRAAEIAAKLEASAVRFTPGPLPEAVEERVERLVEATPEDAERARAIASAISDEKLRETVQKAVTFGLFRGRDDTPI